MDGVPEKCPTCSTIIPEGAVRCPGCGRVFGEDNRCPHCHAIAAVKPSGGGFVCLACGKPRDRLPGTTVLGELDARMSLTPLAPSRPRRSAGPVAIGAGLLAAGASLALLGFSGLGIALALVAAIVGVGGGSALIGAGRTRARKAQQTANRALDQRILALAGKHAGDLRASDVASALHVDESVAEAALMRMSNGGSITAEVDENVGALHFVFHDLVPAPPPTRVELAAEEEEAPDAARAEKKTLSRS